MALMGFALLQYLPVLLALGLFIGVLLTLSRSYRDSEMAVWFSSGLSIAAWVNPVFRFGFPIALLTALLSLFLTPWAWSESAEYTRQLRSKDDVSRVAPGMFIESRGADRVFFLDKTSNDVAGFNNVFVQYNQGGRNGVVVAEKGFQQIDPNGDKFLVLQNGRRYEGTPGQLDFRIVDFERQKILVKAREETAAAPDARQLSLMALVRAKGNIEIAEFHWRIALPIAAIVLAMIAIPLSFVSPRTGASLNLLMAILIFFLYYKLLSIFQIWTAQGEIPGWIGLWPVHFAMVALLLILFSRQLFPFRWLAFSRRS